MTDPDWMGLVKFELVFQLSALLEKRSLLPLYGGFYAFSLDKNKLQRGRVLYVGETENKRGFRARFADYLRSDPTKPQKHAHSAALLLQDHYMRKTSPHNIWVHIAPLEGDPQLIDQLEKAIMQYYMTGYNKAGMRSMTRFDTL